MANFSRPSIHSVDSIKATYLEEHRCLELTLTGSNQFTGQETVELDVFFGPGAPAEYGAKMAAMIRMANREIEEEQNEE